MSTYPSTEYKVRRYFCSTCGCHVFLSQDLNDLKAGTSWEVATGALNDIPSSARIDKHINVVDTEDGGASVWIKELDGEEVAVFPGARPHSFSRTACENLTIPTGTLNMASLDKDELGNLQASCQCGTVRFHVSRPDASSKIPKSPFPDLMIPYHTQAPQITNPENKTWWLKHGDTKYLAGTCTCRSCRLTSGFEIQTWAFVPRSNIYFDISRTHGDSVTEDIHQMPSDFSKLPAGILRSYESSPGVVREFCGTCGATVFWHDKWRPDLIDVSVGLFNAREGARAEDWLEWWTERVSFAEDGKRDRPGKENETGFDLIPGLERGLLAWGKEKTGKKEKI